MPKLYAEAQRHIDQQNLKKNQMDQEQTFPGKPVNSVAKLSKHGTDNKPSAVQHSNSANLMKRRMSKRPSPGGVVVSSELPFDSLGRREFSNISTTKVGNSRPELLDFPVIP